MKRVSEPRVIAWARAMTRRSLRQLLAWKNRRFATRRAPGRHVITPGRADPGQAFVAGEAEDVEAAQILQHIHDLGRPIMRITADGDRDARPVRSDLADDMAQHLRGLLSRRTLAGAQDGGDRLLRCRLEDQGSTGSNTHPQAC